jgi:hypothetical protein
MQDGFVLGHAFWQHLRAEELDPRDQLAALNSSDGQILFDDEHRNLAFLDEIDDVDVHAWCQGLLPPTDDQSGRALLRYRRLIKPAFTAAFATNEIGIHTRRGSRSSRLDVTVAKTT